MWRGRPRPRTGESAFAMNENGALRRKRSGLREAEEREEREDSCSHPKHLPGASPAGEKLKTVTKTPPTGREKGNLPIEMKAVRNCPAVYFNFQILVYYDGK